MKPIIKAIRQLTEKRPVLIKLFIVLLLVTAIACIGNKLSIPIAVRNGLVFYICCTRFKDETLN